MTMATRPIVYPALRAVAERVIAAEAVEGPDGWLERQRARQAFHDTFSPALVLALLCSHVEGER